MIDFFRQVLAIGDGFNNYGDLWECLWWRTDGEYAPVTFFVNCNDLFYWASADCETLTPDNLPLLLQAVKDVRVAFGVDVHDSRELLDGKTGVPDERWNNWFHSGGHGASLFCARVRGMRPQRPVMRKLDARLLPLFEACGPERDRKDEG